MSLRLGLDLDNTIICYDRAFVTAAKEHGLIPEGFGGTKRQVRDHIRATPRADGEILWQKLQGYVYGAGIVHAELFPGALAFLERAKAQGWPVYIVSHKTEFGHFDARTVNLRQAATQFLGANGVFLLLPREQLFFASTRLEKIQKIAALRCDVFVDDLEEVFCDPAFPWSIRKILFTAATPQVSRDMELCPDWTQLQERIFDAPALRDPVHIASALLNQPVDSVQRAGGGGNSRLYRVFAKGASYALKMYPNVQGDTRDRLGTEKKTLLFFERHGIDNVPRWLNDCPGYALLSWVEGELANPPASGEIEQAAAFIGEIKRLCALPDARTMPHASEACTSGSEIVRQIEKRLERLQEAAATEPVLAEFITHAFLPAFHKAHRDALADYTVAEMAFDSPMQSGTCLIPADFGFHNAMRGKNGQLTFIDFEYFGWDDPVKLAADFLLHPAMRLSAEQRGQFRLHMLSLFADDPRFATRLHALTPLFALRWALILLNEFLPERWIGRAFAQGSNEWETIKIRQLSKAKDMLKHSSEEESHA